MAKLINHPQVYQVGYSPVAMVWFKGTTKTVIGYDGLWHWVYLITSMYICFDQRKLGSNTSVLRTNRIVRLDIDAGRCETIHHIAIL